MVEDKHPATPRQDETYIIRHRDHADIVHLQNATAMQRFLEQPAETIAGQMADWLLVGGKALILAGPKIALTAITVKALERFGKELSNWRKNGSIPEDFAGRAPGWQSFVELFAEIDSNPTDEERLDALKAMFLAANRTNTTDGERAVAYQLFQVAKRLNSGELFLLRTVYEAYLSQTVTGQTVINLQRWAEQLAARMGHQLSALVLRDERMLVDQGLISPRLSNPPNEAVRADATARLTDLGIRFCQNIATYRIEQKPAH
jgi:hypothetical protein